MKVNVKSVYTSAACNRIPEIADWNEAGLICYGACNAVVVWDTNLKGKDPLTVLSHHRSQVNSVKWLQKPDGSSTEMVSCSADKTAAIWTANAGEWRVTARLACHTDGITSVFGLYTKGDDLIVYTASIDSTVRVFERTCGVTTHEQTINLSSGLCLTLHAHLLPIVHKPVLFCALDDFKIHVFTGEEYHRVHVLAGHEDWVRGLDAVDVDDTTILLASASQDTYIRVWRIQQQVEEHSTGIHVEERVFPSYGVLWSVKLDAVLAGHEGWVYGVQWQPNYGTNKKLYRLLSSSLDKTLIVWEPSSSLQSGEGEGDGAWVERVRVGEVGGNGLGFYGSRFGPGGVKFLGHGYNGSFHIWSLNKETNQWEPETVCGGHFGVVEDVRWQPEGQYVISVSADQTTRLHAPWKRADVLRGSPTNGLMMRLRRNLEAAECMSIAALSGNLWGRPVFNSGHLPSEDMMVILGVIRVFRAPNNFTRNFANITGVELGEDDAGPLGALVPSLGLSNKAVFSGDDSKTDIEDDNDGYFVPVSLTEPPTEETLMQNTLWAETGKLYGHGYDVCALAASPDGTLLASACRATSAPPAAPLVWDTKTWQHQATPPSHQLTVTQLAFSPDSQYLLSVSRDRKWTLFRREHGSKFVVEAATDKTNGVHSRIIWCCAWAHDGAMFGTGSRDGKVCIWSKTETKTDTSLGQYALLGKPLELPTAVTAMEFAPMLLEGSRVIAVGLECGGVRLYRFDVNGWSLLKELDDSQAHHLTVKRLTFRPRREDDELVLASCGADHFVRINSITVR